MAGIKYILQKEVFDSGDERILSVCNVTKLFKKKKTSYLCITQLTKPRIVVSVSQVKQQDKGVYKKKRIWLLDEIRSVDGKSEAPETHEFDITLDKVYRWFAPNLHERQNFIVVLWRMYGTHGSVNKPQFVNVPQTWLMDTSPDSGGVEKTDEQVDSGNADMADYEEFNALTEREERDLNKLMTECNFAINNAELFIEQLGKNLQDLDGANVQSVLASEQQVDALMSQIEVAITEAEKVEERLDAYDEILCHIRETMEKMGEKNSMIEISNNNNIKLMQQLEKVVVQLDLPYAHQLALADTDLTTPQGLSTAIAAGKVLQNAMNCNIDAALLRLTAVQDQRKRFEKWKAKFSQTISRHLNNMFIHHGNDLSDPNATSTAVAVGELTLPKHSAVHQELSAYAELMHWLKLMDRKAYDALMKVYTCSLSKVYDRDIRVFFEQGRQQIANKKWGSRDEMNTSVSNKLKLPPTAKQVAHAYGTLGVNRDQWMAGTEPSERLKLDAILERMLAELEPIALAEQMFCISFFQMDVLSPTTKNTQTTLECRLAGNSAFNGGDKDERNPVELPQKRIDRQINEEVRKMMTELFGQLEQELINFINSFEKLDSFYSMYVLVLLTQHVMSAQDAHSFLSMTFATALVQVKRTFDKFMQQQLMSVRESRPPKRSKCGLLPYVENFEEFAATAESIFRKSERRTDLDKWYLKLVEVIFEQIPLHAVEHPKTPRQVVCMENFHRMHSLLAQRKITALDNLRKDAKAKYNDALFGYVTKYFGRPLEKLNLFFEGVQQKVAQGVKETEISYQMAFSKQELRKVIGQYPAREVKKGLESLYKKVEKHLCDEENLLQVVWRAMQEEFIDQYNYLEERIQRCYAGAMINLDFSISDILEFFSEIARSH